MILEFIFYDSLPSEQITCIKKYISESESDSVIITGEVKKPPAKSNALEEHLQASPVYSLDWLKSLLVLYY